MPSQQLQNIIEMLRARPVEPDIPIAELRVAFEMLGALFKAADDVTASPVDAGGVPAEWISAPNADPSGVLYWLHGGGYCIGSINTHRELVGRLSRITGMRGLALDYRLAPEHPFPAAVDDAVAGYRWLLAQGVAPSRIVIGGDSAGGGLTAAALVVLRDAGTPLPAAAVMLSPWTDLEGSGESIISKAEADPMVTKQGLDRMSAAYRGATGAREPLVSPIYADLSGLPPMLIHIGTSEILLDDATRLAARAKAAGVDVTLEAWEDMIHVWHIFAAAVPESRQAVERIGEWVRSTLGVPAAAEQAAS